VADKSVQIGGNERPKITVNTTQTARAGYMRNARLDKNTNTELVALERWREALAAYDAGLAVDPTNAETLNNQRRPFAAGQERFELAVAALQRFVTHSTIAARPCWRSDASTTPA